MKFAIDIDSMDEGAYSRFRQFFDLMAMSIRDASVADALLICVPDDMAPVAIRMAGEMGAEWQLLENSQEMIEQSVSVETVEAPAPIILASSGKKATEKRCEICGDPVAHPRCTICTKDSCRRERQRRYQARTDEKRESKKGTPVTNFFAGSAPGENGQASFAERR
jgi:hypothetical protein